MAPGDLDGTAGPASAPPSARRPLWARGLACVAILPLLGFIGGQGRTLWEEWRQLRNDRVSERASAVIGYIDISPNVSTAGRPDDWIHDEGDQTLLWAGYRDSAHHWFRVGRGEIDLARLSLPVGRDAIRAVDQPMFERAGGIRWGRIPDESRVVGLEEGDEPAVYPVGVLEKVVVVNDATGDRPTLATYSPFENAANVYRPDLGGKPVRMGLTGYFVGYAPLLFDRETDSFWVEREGAVVALSGPRKGASLPRIARITPVSWGEWRAQHPRSRLLIGANRSREATPGGPSLAP